MVKKNKACVNATNGLHHVCNFLISFPFQLYSLQDPQDIVLGGDMPISSIQATIAKLSIRPSSGSPEAINHYQPPPFPVISEQATTELSQLVLPPSSSQPDLVAQTYTEPAPSPVPPQPTSNGPAADVPAEAMNHHALVAEDVVAGPEASNTPAVPPSSSLNLLAALTPEAFNLDSNQRGKQKMNKQSFLQPQNDGGLARGSKADDDPLSMLDPLWTLNKT